ncbi:MAG TPA: response regulator [Ktedonobacterales bacterium]|jgi:CheY-like chemotaxis protein|nr:response regulator [Ktedonobacterales bacterium]
MTTVAGRRVWRVLVVDDEENLNWSLVTSLRRDNYVADGALTGEQAMQRMAGVPYDIIISDVKMPGMDGFELLQWVRQNRPQTRVLMMTAFGSPTDRAMAIRGGVVAYLEKPFDLRALKDELRRLTAAPSEQRPSGPTDSEGYDLLEVTRVISLARRDIALVVESNGRVGHLRFARGELIWADAGETQGDEAFVLLTSPRVGRAQPEPWNGQTGRNINQPLANLIFTAMTQRDRSLVGDPTRASASLPLAAARGTGPAPAVPAAATPAPSIAVAPAGPASLPPLARTTDPLSPLSPSPNGTAGQTSALQPLAPVQVSRVRAVVEQVAEALPQPGGVALLRPDGTVVAQRWMGAGEPTGGAYAHLAACGQAALRGLLVGGWGDLEDVRISSGTRVIVVRRVGRSDRAALVILNAPRDADLSECQALLAARDAELVDALR